MGPWMSSLVLEEEGSGRTMATLLLALRFRRVRLVARERAGELVRMPLGEGRLEMWLMDAEVWRSEVSGM